MPEARVERRGRSRLPLKLILVSVCTAATLWLFELYMQPTWAKIRSFVLGYFLGTFVMEWIHQRASRAEPSAESVLPNPAATRAS
jgi:hypothetical protein